MINNKIALLGITLILSLHTKAQQMLKIGFHVPIIDSIYVKDSTIIVVSYDGKEIFNGKVGNNGIAQFGKIINLTYSKDDVINGAGIVVTADQKNVLSLRIDALNLKSKFLSVSYTKNQFSISMLKRKYYSVDGRLIAQYW